MPRPLQRPHPVLHSRHLPSAATGVSSSRERVAIGA